MIEYKVTFDFALDDIEDITAPVTIGRLHHGNAFSWALIVTPTNGDDRFFDVPMHALNTDGMTFSA